MDIGSMSNEQAIKTALLILVKIEFNIQIIYFKIINLIPVL